MPNIILANLENQTLWTSSEADPSGEPTAEAKEQTAEAPVTAEETKASE